ncbi:MAG: hypothetical protein QXD13_00525 [Candidatus Pacearchaeota archaeon]
MILSKKPITLAEASVLVKTLEEKKPIHDYLKKFAKLSQADAKKMRDEIVALNNLKLKEEHIIKIIDFIPKDLEDLGKVLNDVSLSEAELNAILEITKKY